jgi:hypothetical protein
VNWQAFDNVGHNYTFNVCGNSNQHCNPSWTPVYRKGVAIQVRPVT